MILYWREYDLQGWVYFNLCARSWRYGVLYAVYIDADRSFSGMTYYINNKPVPHSIQVRIEESFKKAEKRKIEFRAALEIFKTYLKYEISSALFSKEEKIEILEELKKEILKY